MSSARADDARPMNPTERDDASRDRASAAGAPTCGKEASPFLTSHRGTVAVLAGPSDGEHGALLRHRAMASPGAARPSRWA